jgi:hypothetical protein
MKRKVMKTVTQSSYEMFTSIHTYRLALAESQLTFFPTFAVAANGMKKAGAMGVMSSKKQLLSRAIEERRRHLRGSLSNFVLTFAANITEREREVYI